MIETILQWLGVKKALAMVSLIGAVVSLKFVREKLTPAGAVLMVMGGWSSSVYGTEALMSYIGIPPAHLLATGFFVAVFSMSLCAALANAIHTIDLGGIAKTWLSKRRD